MEDREGVFVERVGGFGAPDVVDGYIVCGGAVVVLGGAFGLLFDPVVGRGPVRGGGVEVEVCFYVATWDWVFWGGLGLGSHSGGFSAGRGREVVGGGSWLG